MYQIFLKKVSNKRGENVATLLIINYLKKRSNRECDIQHYQKKISQSHIE